MSFQCFGIRLVLRSVACFVIFGAGNVLWLTISTGHAQLLVEGIGGVCIDGEGVLSNLSASESARLQKVRQQALAAVPGDLSTFTDLRFVSLGRLAKMAEQSRRSGKPLPEEVQFMAGLQRIRYLLVLPESHDLVLAGPAEGWKVDALGNIVGTTTGRPVLLMDDLIVALNTYSKSGGIATCSIDPTQDGLQRLSTLAKQLRPSDASEAVARRLEETLGPQNITIHGVDATSHFARVMIAADFRMKRLAMGFEPSPIPGLPSYLEMVRPGPSGMNNMLPRWWLGPKYDALQTDGEELVWEICGQGVQCLSEEDFVTADGQKTRTGKANPQIERWAQLMTQKYSELSDHDSTFGQVRNLMDLAVISALIWHKNLEAKTGVDLSLLASMELSERFHAPQFVATKVTFIKKGRNRIFSASGGVDVSPWKALTLARSKPDIIAIRSQGTPETGHWWWQ
ncbi:MAG: DUF1598 domain-containing protein [Pirellulales bacterium]|nr:DUF1598 domain-containing protein [Pirellulales bacterium]